MPFDGTTRTNKLSLRSRQRLHALADDIERAAHFDMAHFFGDKFCRTASCIAGFAIVKYGRFYYGEYVRDFGFVAQDILGLNAAQREELFYASQYLKGLGEPVQKFIALSQISQHHAAATLRHLAETGVVDWETNAPA